MFSKDLLLFFLGIGAILAADCPSLDLQPYSSRVSYVSFVYARVDAFMKIDSGSIVHATFASGVWGPWVVRSGTIYFKSQPFAIAWGPNRLDIFARGLDDYLYHIFWDGTIWTGPVLVNTNTQKMTSEPFVASYGVGSLNVYFRGTVSNQIWMLAYSAGVWSTITKISSF